MPRSDGVDGTLTLDSPLDALPELEPVHFAREVFFNFPNCIAGTMGGPTWEGGAFQVDDGALVGRAIVKSGCTCSTRRLDGCSEGKGKKVNNAGGLSQQNKIGCKIFNLLVVEEGRRKGDATWAR